jgi:hypothetical protein
MMLGRKKTAKILNVSVRTVDRLRKNGLLPWIDLTGGHGKRPIVRFLESDIEDFFQKMRKDAKW